MPITERGRWASTVLDERGQRIVGSLTERGLEVVTSGGNPSGSATLQGVGTISANGQTSGGGSATLQGVGTFTASGLASRTGAAPLQGVGTITAGGGISAINGASTMQGVGTYAATATASRTGAASFQGVGTITANGQAAGSFTGSATLLGVGRLKIGTPKNLIDNFSRADFGGIGTSDSGHVWQTEYSGGWDIYDGAAQMFGANEDGLIYVDTGLRDVGITYAAYDVFNPAIYFRFVHTLSYLRVSFRDFTTLYLEKRVGNTLTLLASAPVTFGWGNTLQVYDQGGMIDVFIDNIPVLTGYLETTTNVGVTKQGFGSAIAQSGDRLNFFAVESQGYHDTFERASASTLGNPSTFIGWQYANGGTWATTNDFAATGAITYNAYVSTNTNNAMAYTETPSPNSVISVDMEGTGMATNINVSTPRLIFRMIDTSNYLAVYFYNDLFWFDKVDGGVTTNLLTDGSVGVADRAGLRYHVVMIGKQITFYWGNYQAGDGHTFGSHTLSTANAKYEYGTKVGFSLKFAGAPAKPALWDNFAVRPLVAGPSESFVFDLPTMQGVGTFTAGGIPTRNGAATLQGVGTFSANGSNISAIGSSSMQGVGVFAASGSGSAIGGATLQGVGTITAAGAGSIVGSAALQGVGVFSALGNTGSGAFLQSVGTFTANPTIRYDNAAALTGVATFAATGQPSSSVALRGVATFTANGTARRDGASTMQGVGTISATINGLQTGSASMFAVAMLLASGAGGLPNVDKVSLIGERILRVSMQGEKALSIPLQGGATTTERVKASKPPPVSLGGEI